MKRRLLSVHRPLTKRMLPGLRPYGVVAVGTSRHGISSLPPAFAGKSISWSAAYWVSYAFELLPA